MATYYKIVLDGTGLSGTLCQHHVRRLRPLLPGRPEYGRTRNYEPCGETARWWRVGTGGVPFTLCTRHRRIDESKHPATEDQSTKESEAMKRNSCSGSGRAPSETYTRPVKGSGGVVREQQRGTCPDNGGHRDLPIHGGNVQGH